MTRDDLPVKSCENCGKDFFPTYTSMQVACSLRCAVSLAKKHRKAKEKAERAQTRARKDAIKKRSELKALAQEQFNKFIRARDADKPCVSCGIVDPPMTRGGQWDAGHFLTRGAHPELAFDEDNCHKQCKKCNAGGGKFRHKERTVNARFEEELLRRIGPERLERLKGPHEAKKWTREELRAIAATYRQKRKELERMEEKA